MHYIEQYHILGQGDSGTQNPLAPIERSLRKFMKPYHLRRV